MESSKASIIDLRIILLGDSEIGKKSIVQRFKMLKSTETKEISLKDFIKKKNAFHKSKKIKIPKEIPVTDEEKFQKLQEDKRLHLMRFTKIFRLELNNIQVSFCPCPNAEPLDYDYEPKDEEDENYDFEKEYKISIKKMMSEIEFTIIRPAEDPRAQVEILFLLCFDLSNFSSFENLVIFFSQINKHFKITHNDFKLALIGTKLDMKKSFRAEEKENIENFKNELKINYYEISSLMFFNFDNFFEKIILDIYGNIFPFFSSDRYKNIFHEILRTNHNFTKTKRGKFEITNDNPGPNKYNNNVYEYPKNKRELYRIFKNKLKFNKKIFINKRSILFPPIKYIKEEMNSEESNKKNQKEAIEEFLTINWDILKDEKIKSVLELDSNKPGFSLGMKTNKSLGLRKERENLRNEKEKEMQKILDGYIVSSSQVMPIRSFKNSLSLAEYQNKYEQNRNEKMKKKLEARKEISNTLQERHNEVLLKNSRSFNQKMYNIEQKQKKYENIRKYLENQKLNKKYNTIDDENKSLYKYTEPKSKFYDPISSISTKKGFTFGKKLEIKYEKKESPDYPTFMDDFEKLLEKNQKRIVVKSVGNRFPVYKTEEVGDSSYIMEKQKDFEKKRKRFRTHLFSDFFDNRREKKQEVIQNKKNINDYQEQKMKEQIQKTYGTKENENYLIRDINYNQIETSSPKFSIKGKYKGELFSQFNNYDDDYNHKRFSTISGKENDFKRAFSNLNLNTIYPKYPAFSFGSAKRFDFLEEKLKREKSKEKLNNRYDDELNDYNIFKSYQDTQSFLMAQTYMGKDEKLKTIDNGNPGPGMYKIKGFADDVAFRGTKINLTRMKIREKEKDDEIDKERRAKLREQWLQEKKAQLKMGIKDYYNSKLNK